MKKLILALLTFLVAAAIVPHAAFADQIALQTPQTVALDPIVQTFGCYAEAVTVRAYSTVVTGFSADGNYITGQAPAHFTCGHSGRGATIHTYYSCVQLTWDLSGALVSATDVIAFASNGAPTSYNCPAVDLVLPSRTPPSAETVGNSFTNDGGYVAETLMDQPCGSIACYGLPLSFPTLITP